MKKRILTTIAVLAICCTQLLAQSPEVIRNYINKFKDVAIEEMQRTGVPAAITLAQGIHETGAGTSDLVIKSNNHFGIKCKSDWTGPAVYHDDDARGECFRKYDDPMISYRDHSDFLKLRPYYASLFELDPTDYKGWAYGLKKAGYATNPKYPQILIKIIEDYNLQDYSLVALHLKDSVGSGPVWVSNTSTTPSSLKEGRVEKDLSSIYPSTIFRINDTRVVLVKKGTSYLKIATENDLSLSRLFEFNDMAEEDIAAFDRLIFLQRKRKQGASEWHQVQEGETVYDVAQSEGIRLDELLAYNLLQPGMQPRAGERLSLRSKASSMPQLITANTAVVAPPVIGVDTAATESAEFFDYTVQPKETAYAITKKYGVSLEDLLKWNDLSSADLKVGQTLRIKKNK